MEELEWVRDEDGCENLYLYGIHVWIERRPWYCDRGHFLGNCLHGVGRIEGLPDIDHQDAFPRYYMDLERGKAELKDWLKWRLHRLEQTDPQLFAALKARGR